MRCVVSMYQVPSIERCEIMKVLCVLFIYTVHPQLTTSSFTLHVHTCSTHLPTYLAIPPFPPIPPKVKGTIHPSTNHTIPSFLSCEPLGEVGGRSRSDCTLSCCQRLPCHCLCHCASKPWCWILSLQLHLLLHDYYYHYR